MFLSSVSFLITFAATRAIASERANRGVGYRRWLNLQDVYWTNQGRQRIDAIVIAGSLLSIRSWDGAFWRGMPKVLFGWIGGR